MKNQKKKEERTDKILAKRKKKKKRRENELTEPRRRKEKKGSKGAADLTSGFLHVCLITKMPLETELWKLKTAKMCFQFL